MDQNLFIGKNIVKIYNKKPQISFRAFLFFSCIYNGWFAYNKKELLNNGFVKVDEKNYYKLIQANEFNLDSSCESLLKQLKEDGKYNYYIPVYNFNVQSATDLVHIDRLPVFGDSKKWVTRWFYQSKENAVKKALQGLKEIGFITK